MPSNLKYTLTDYTLLNTLCDDRNSTECKLGSITTLHITISYNANQYDSSNTTFLSNLNFKFYSINATARIGNQYFDTLKLAVESVTGSETTTIQLLKDTSEVIVVNDGQNIIFDLQNYTLSNKGNNNVIKSYGNTTITNGTISSSADTKGAVDVESTGTVTMTGGRIIATGGRQALYNNGGTANISGTAYLSNTTSERAAVHNYTSSSVLNIRGGTIIATGNSAVENKGKMTIGTSGGGVSSSSPLLQGATYGIYSSTNYSFYDGIAKGITDAVNNQTRIVNWETGYNFLNSTEAINGAVYRTVRLSRICTVTFYPNGGTVTEHDRGVVEGGQIGTLPVPTRTGFIFEGWFTSASGGSEILATSIVEGDTDIYAHWIDATNVVVARIGTTEYNSLAAAITATPAATATTIVLERNTIETITVASGKNIILDLQNYTVSNSGNHAVFENNGTITITNGTISSTADTAAINNNSTGRLIMTGGSIIATGSRQAIYNVGGTIEISGSAYLSSGTSGKPTNSNMERGTIQNLTGGTLIITGGTIIGTKQQAISNEGTLTIGTDDGTVNSTTPIIQGETIAIRTSDTFNFYDGIIKGITDPPVLGTITNQDVNSTITYGNEVVGSKTYVTEYLS